MVESIIDDKIGSRLVTGDEGVMGQLYSRYGINTTPAGTELLLNAIDYFRETKEDVTTYDLVMLQAKVEKMLVDQAKQKERSTLLVIEIL